MTRTVLITGGTGFVGSHAIEAYAAAGWHVRALVRNPARRPWSADIAVEILVGGLDRKDVLLDAARGCDVVVHCAALTKTARREEFYRVNSVAVGVLTEAAREGGVRRLVYCSTHAASGPAQDGVASRESDSPQPLSDYGKSKLAGEEKLKQLAGDMSWIILRPPSILGPRDEQFVPLFRAVVRYGICPRFGSGNQVYSFIYVKDFARALLQAGGADHGLNDTYFVAHAETLNWESAAHTIARCANRHARTLRIPVGVLKLAGQANDAWASVTGKPALLSSDKVREILARPWVCSTEKIQQAWGFKCEYSIEQALRETLEYYRRTHRV